MRAWDDDLPLQVHDGAGNRYWFRKGQKDARDRWFVLGVIGGWISAALFAGALYWLGAL